MAITAELSSQKSTDAITVPAHLNSQCKCCPRSPSDDLRAPLRLQRARLLELPLRRLGARDLQSMRFWICFFVAVVCFFLF